MSGCRKMWAQNAKHRTNSQLQNTFKKKEILSFSVIGCSFSALHFAPTLDDTLTIVLVRKGVTVEESQSIKENLPKQLR